MNLELVILSMKSLLICLVTPSLLCAQTLKPGIWKGQASFTVNNIPLPSTQDEDCILPHEVKDVKGSLVKNLKKQGCSLTKWEVRGQKIEASLVCKGQDIDATGSLKGQFSDKSYKLSGEVKGTFKEMLPAIAQVELQGEWVKSCN